MFDPSSMLMIASSPPYQQGVEVGRRVIDPVHVDRNPVELAEPRHTDEPTSPL